MVNGALCLTFEGYPFPIDDFNKWWADKEKHCPQCGGKDMRYLERDFQLGPAYLCRNCKTTIPKYEGEL